MEGTEQPVARDLRRTDYPWSEHTGKRLWKYFDEMVEERDGLIEKYKARRWLVRAARKNLPWEVQQRLFASLEALSYDCVIQILLDDPVEFKVLEDDDPHERGDAKEALRLIHEEHVSATRNNSHALFLACYHGLTEVVSDLLSMRCVDPRSGNPLAAACESGHIDAVKLLLADPRVDPTMDESMSIQLAAQSGHQEIVKILLEDGRPHPNRANGNPLVCACAYGYLDVVTLLLDDPRTDPAVRDNMPLTRACEQGALEVVKLLLARPGVSVSESENKPLLVACTTGNLEIAKLLINEYDADPSWPQNLPLFNACYSGNLELVKFLLSFDNVDPSEPGDLPFQIAAQMNHLEMLRFLLQDPRVDPTARDNYSLSITASSGFLEAVKLLLADDRVLKVAKLREAVAFAIESEHVDVVAYLLYFNPKETLPETSWLLYAVEVGNLEILELLLSFPDLDPHLHQDQMQGLIQAAARGGQVEIYKQLVGDPRTHTETGDNVALTLAIDGNHSELVDVMIQDPRIGNLEEGLIDACKKGHVDVVKVLLNSERLRKETANIPDLDNAIHMACMSNYHEILGLMLSAIQDYELQATHILLASQDGSIEALRVMNDKRYLSELAGCSLDVAANEQIFLQLLSWHIWPKWRLLLLGLKDPDSPFSELPLELFTELSRVARFAYDQESARQWT